jgi:uncharacterized OB-fold protein
MKGIECPECGAMLLPDDEVCPECDAPVKTKQTKSKDKKKSYDKPQSLCGECGAEWTYDDECCPECGASMFGGYPGEGDY